MAYNIESKVFLFLGGQWVSNICLRSEVWERLAYLGSCGCGWYDAYWALSDNFGWPIAARGLPKLCEA